MDPNILVYSLASLHHSCLTDQCCRKTRCYRKKGLFIWHLIADMTKSWANIFLFLISLIIPCWGKVTRGPYIHFQNLETKPYQHEMFIFFSNKTKIQTTTYIIKGFIYQNICSSAAFSKDVFIQNKNVIWGVCFRCCSVQYVKNRVPYFQSYKLYQPLHAVCPHRLFYFVASFPACLLGTLREVYGWLQWWAALTAQSLWCHSPLVWLRLVSWETKKCCAGGKDMMCWPVWQEVRLAG